MYKALIAFTVFIGAGVILSACGGSAIELYDAGPASDAAPDAPVEASLDSQIEVGPEAAADIADEPLAVALTVSPPSVHTFPGCADSQLHAAVVYSDNSTTNVTDLVTWECSDPLVATVDAEGRVTGHDEGETTVTARWSGLSGEVDVSVGSPALTHLSVEPASATLAIGDSVTLGAFAHFADCDGSTVEVTAGWSSSDPTIAAVKNGVVTGMTAGTVTITAAVYAVGANGTVTVTP